MKITRELVDTMAKNMIVVYSNLFEATRDYSYAEMAWELAISLASKEEKRYAKRFLIAILKEADKIWG